MCGQWHGAAILHRQFKWLPKVKDVCKLRSRFFFAVVLPLFLPAGAPVFLFVRLVLGPLRPQWQWAIDFFRVILPCAIFS